MQRFVSVIFVMIAIVAAGCGKSDQEEPCQETVVGCDGVQRVTPSAPVNGEPALVCPEQSGWWGKTPEQAALATVCLNTERSLEFKNVESLETNADSVVVYVHAEEYGCPECPRSVTCEHDVLYKRQEGRWEAQDIASDNCAVPQSTIDATATAQATIEDVEHRALVESVSVVVLKKEATIDFTGVEAELSIEPDLYSEKVRVWVTLQFDDGHIQTLEAGYYSGTAKGLIAIVPGQQDHAPRNHGPSARLLSTQVVWIDAGCIENCSETVYGPVVTLE
jgi:hypothetical protein